MSIPEAIGDAEIVELARHENKLGQGIRDKGAATRRSLMAATLRLLANRSPQEVSVHGIARAAGTSPATFYVYFKTVNEVILALVETIREPYQGEILPTLQPPWRGNQEDHVRRFVLAYHSFWNQHRRLLAARNLEADLGDDQFINQRIDMARPVVDALADRIQGSSGESQMSRADAWAQAVVCCAGLEEMFSYPPGAYRVDVPVTAEDVVRAQIRLICGVLNTTTNPSK